jgi:hypothetical protein
MQPCCARMVPPRGAGGVGDSLLAPRLGHGGFGAGGARWVSSRILARSACSVSLPTLASLSVLSLLRLAAAAAAGGTSTGPDTAAAPALFPHSPHPSSSSAGGFCLAWPIIHFPPLARSSRPASRWFRPRAVACEKARAEMEKAES